MIDRIVEIASPARLSVRNDQLVVARRDVPDVTTPLAEMAVLLLAEPQVSLTQAVLSRLAALGGMAITIDEKYLPAAMMLPVQMHSLQSERFARQVAMTVPLQKRLWRKLVRAKLRAQGNLLASLHGSDGGLPAMAARVRSGDTGNLEAQAARRYWPLLFADPKFRRGGEGTDQNRHLDYGYMVLRAAAARALCACGLHPSIGLFHHNRYDAFCLAADLMEPFRPIIDRRVYEWIQENDPSGPLERPARHWILGALTQRFAIAGESRTLFDLLARAADGLARAMEGNEDAFQPPESFLPCSE